MENIIKQGYLKRAIISDDFTVTSSKNFTNNFRQKLEPSRWYVFGVRRRQPYLEYFEKEQSSFTGSPISSYNLTACTGISYTLGNTNRNYSFCVFLDGQVLELNAPSREEMVSWCSVLERNLRRLGILDKHSRREHIYSAFPVKPKPVPAPQTSPNSISLEDVVPTRSTIFIERRWEEQKEKNPCQEMQSIEGQAHQDSQVNMDTELLGATGGVSEKSEREKYYLDDEEIHVSIDSIKLEDLLAEEEERVQDLKRKTDYKEEQNNGGQNKIEMNDKKTDSTETSDRDTSEDSDFISASFWLRNRKPTITAMPRDKSKVSAAFGQTGQSLLDSILHDEITQMLLVPMRRSYNSTENSHKQGKRMALSMCEISSSGQNCVGFAEPGLNNSLYSFGHASSEYYDINEDGQCADKFKDESEEDDSRYEMLVDKISPPLPPRENRVQQALYEATWTPIKMGKAEYKEKLADIQKERLVSSSGGNSFSTNPQSSHLSPESTEKHGQDNFYSELPLEIPQTGKFNLHNNNNDPRTIGKVVEKTDKIDLPPRLITKIPVGNPEPPPVNSIPKRANVATELVSNFLPKGTASKSMLLKNDPSFDNDGINDTTCLIPFEDEASPIPVAPPRRNKSLTLDLRSEPMSAANYNYHNKTDLISDENLNHIVGSYNLRSPEKKLGNVDDIPISPPVPPPRDIEKKTAPPSPPVPPPRDIDKKTTLPIPPLPKRNVPNSTRKIKSQEDLPSGSRNETYVATRPRSTYLSFRQQLSLSPGALVVMNLKQSQVDILKAEIATTQGLILRIPKQHFQNGLALVECFGTIWIAGWDLKKYARLFDKFHIGDQLVAIQDVQVSDLSFVQKVVKNCQSQTMEVIIRRLPHAQVYAIRRNAECENLGIKRDGGTAEILYVDPLGLAAKHGLPSKAHMVENVGTCSWMLTEINSRPLNLFFKDAEIDHLLSAVGLDISIVVQPADFIKELKKQLKKIKGYKDFLVK
ncbi:hypothetical protein CHS0354_003614 [Potamilus streckersoni]|uniref:PH domain-containing protein n=1 Tax=Potamilus streckersoni TaxID=2493646 RepID=A0AAE0VSG1_9BIVA|nr:hypothetical protein CHS0354_003614 [Potamilus streckersoni]